AVLRKWISPASQSLAHKQLLEFRRRPIGHFDASDVPIQPEEVHLAAVPGRPGQRPPVAVNTSADIEGAAVDLPAAASHVPIAGSAFPGIAGRDDLTWTPDRGDTPRARPVAGVI